MGSPDHTRPGPPPDRLPFRSRAELRQMLDEALAGERRSRHGVDLDELLRRAGAERPSDAEPLWLHEFTFPAAPEAIAEARRRVAEFAADCGLHGLPLYDMTLAADEALSNAVRHGSPGHERDAVDVRVGVTRRSVAVEVRDRGRGFDLARTERADPQATSGRGIQFMRALVDVLQLASSPNGTSVLLLKRAA